MNARCQSSTPRLPSWSFLRTRFLYQKHVEQDHIDQQKKKLFVGMTPKSAYEEDYRAVFAPFGTLFDIYVIRDRNGLSKGCAFVRYESAHSANHAIEALHDKHIMPGGFRTLVVTIADDRRAPHAAAGCPTAARRDTIVSGDGLSRSLHRPASFLGSEGRVSSAASLIGPQRSSAAAPQTGAVAFGSTVAQGNAPAGVLPGMPYFLCGGSPPQGTYVYYPYVPSSPSQSDAAVSVPARGVSTKPHHAFSIGPHGMGNQCDRAARGVHEKDTLRPQRSGGSAAVAPRKKVAVGRSSPSVPPGLTCSCTTFRVLSLTRTWRPPSRRSGRC